MPISTGYQLNYTDASSGLTLSGAWLEIGRLYYDVHTGCQITAHVYKSQADYDAKKMSVFYISRDVAKNSSDWNTYFDPDVLSEVGKNFVSQAILYLQSVL